MIKRIYAFLSLPKVLLFGWSIFLLSPFLGIIRLQFLTNANLKIFRISGLSALMFYTPFVISIFILFAIVIWFIEFTKGRLNDFHKKYISTISFFTVIFLIISQFLINREFNTYPNFLYQHYGITIVQLQLMSFVAAVQLVTFIAFYVYKTSYIKSKRLVTNIKSPSAPFLISVMGIVCLLVLSASTILGWPVLYRESKEGYEGKVGVDYKYMNLTSTHTPDNIVVIHPPQGDEWPAIGNQPVLRYFLYPRTLVSGALVTNQEFTKNIQGAYFVIIDPEGSRNWPTINFKNNTIVFDTIKPVKFKSLDLFFENKISKIYKINF